MMQRRGFLGAILAAGVAPAFVGAKVLMPVRAIALATQAEIAYIDNFSRSMQQCGLITSAMIQAETMRILHNNTGFLLDSINQAYPLALGTTVNIRKPPKFTFRA